VDRLRHEQKHLVAELEVLLLSLVTLVTAAPAAIGVNEPVIFIDCMLPADPLAVESSDTLKTLRRKFVIEFGASRTTPHPTAAVTLPPSAAIHNAESFQDLKSQFARLYGATRTTPHRTAASVQASDNDDNDHSGENDGDMDLGSDLVPSVTAADDAEVLVPPAAAADDAEVPRVKMARTKNPPSTGAFLSILFRVSIRYPPPGAQGCTGTRALLRYPGP